MISAHLAELTFEREELADLSFQLDREWLVTNGIGGYASSSLCCANTRRYHGLLVAALHPPAGRTVMLARLDEELEIQGERIQLGTAEFHDGTIHPQGYRLLERFALSGTVPVWMYRTPAGTVRKTLWMPYGRNCTYVRYELLDAALPATLHLAPLVTYRDYHHETRGDPAWRMTVMPRSGGCTIVAFDGAVPLSLEVAPGGTFVETPDWYWRYLHRREHERGLDFLEDLYRPGVLSIPLVPGYPVVLRALAGVEEHWPGGRESPDAEWARQRALIQQAQLPLPEQTGVAGRLVLAADQFIVRRTLPGEPSEGRTILAGYHWFTDWGRDTMIALPGLCLCTRRFDEARAILATFARFVDRGMLPNRFPDAGETPDYNTADATLWYFEALARYERASGDRSLTAQLYPLLLDIIAWHRRGTRYAIGMDPADALLHAGEPGTQLTWMDVKIGDWAVTPRTGKPVEINALWINALALTADWARVQGDGAAAAELGGLAGRARASFNRRFWYAAGGYCYDIVDGPDGDDASLRPNQLIAASLTHPALEPRYWEPMLRRVRQALLTPYGLRTLAPDDPRYRGVYAGDQWQRDTAYHQGTAWPWLLGPYVDVALRAGEPPEAVREVLLPLVEHLRVAGVGTVSEVYDGDPPHRPGGCIAQAWSVGELLRAWLLTGGAVAAPARGHAGRHRPAGDTSPCETREGAAPAH